MALSLEDRARAVRIVILDVDGTLTDGTVWYSSDGEALKRFSIRDGQGIAMLRQAGIEVALMTRERSEIVARRAEKLGLHLVRQRVADKAEAVEELLAQEGLAHAETCFVGDDLPDLEAIRKVGLGVAVADAADEVRAAADLVTSRPGGGGAVREVCGLILDAKGEPHRVGPLPPAQA